MTAPDLKDAFHRGMWTGGGGETSSGAGSTLRYTQRLRPVLSELLDACSIRSMVDAGCGDFNWMQHVAMAGVDYVGFDIQQDLIAENERRYGRPGRRFQHADITKHPIPAADLLMCRDVLLHLPFANIADLFENISNADLRFVLLTSYKEETNEDLPRPGKARPVNLAIPPFRFPPALVQQRLPDWIQGFPVRALNLYRHDALRDHLARSAGDLRSFVTVSAGAAAPDDPEERQAERLRPRHRYPVSDIPEDTAGIIARWPDEVSHYATLFGSEATLASCIAASLGSFGFFTGQASRYFENPWLIETLRGLGLREGVAVDIGAGLSPIPLMLATAGFRVKTFDGGSPRSVSDKPEDEWGFFDYSAVHSGIESFNVDFSAAALPPESVDIVYSVSVVEHMPADTRRDTLSAAAAMLRRGGRLLLTLDLVPGSNALWNRSQGAVVEEADTHGDLCAIIDELRAVGFALDYLDLKRGLPRSRTDIAVLHARKTP